MKQSILLVVVLLVGCAALRRPPELMPFDRAVLLVFDSAQHHKGVGQALLALDLELNQPKKITVRAFDDRDRPLAVNPKLIAWTASSNIKIEPESGATVRVTLLSEGGGQIQVSAAGHRGEIRVR
jgi:hypothetical protein